MERRIKGVLSPKASGSITITENGNYDVVDVANAVVDVRPSGTIEITENGEHDVANYEKANVNVQFKATTLKGYLDVVKSMEGVFKDRADITDLSSIISYNDTENVENMNYAFKGTNLETSPKLNLKKVKSMNYTFNECINLKSCELEELLSCEEFYSTFNNCKNLKNVKIDTTFAKNLENAFYNCWELETLPPLNTVNCENLNSTFSYCKKIKKIEITYYNISEVQKAHNICRNSYELKYFIIRQFGSNYLLGTNVFYGGSSTKVNILVPRTMVDTLKSATNWSIYATQLRALEDYTIDGTTTGEIDESKLV